ncbi:MAG: flagellar basal body rod protein FlgB [Pseudomonadota bacterium]
MDPSRLIDQTTQLVQANLDRRSTAQRLISRNLANVDTPGFRGSNLEFQTQLRAALEGGVVPPAMARTNARHLPVEPPAPYSQAKPVYKDTGPVQLDIEMSRLAENNIMFNAMVQLLTKKYSMLKNAINEGGAGR